MNAARNVERAYRSPEIVHQRLETLKALNVRPGECVLDAGCGPGLLSEALAALVGDDGRVVAVDKSADMLALARQRCGEARVELREASIERLADDDGAFDAVACTQVLLYVQDIAGVIGEMRRVLRTGGRLVIVETDWRSCVLSSSDFALTEIMIRAWDDAVPSPNLPMQLAPMLRSCGFNAVRVEAIPVLDDSLVPDGYSFEMIQGFAAKAVEQDKVTGDQAKRWLADLHERARKGEYLFCVNRFLFCAVA